MSSVLNTTQTRNRITELLACNRTLRALSAYFTLPAYNWLNNFQNPIDVTLTMRGRPIDFLTGASSVIAVEQAISSGWSISFNSALHAKLYIIEKDVIIGSGNLTSNGMNLININGNVELNVETKLTREIEQTVEAIEDSSTLINSSNLAKIKTYLLNKKEESGYDEDWPDTIIEQNQSKLFCSDFPLAFPINTSSGKLEEPWSSLMASVASEDFDHANKLLKRTKAYIWLEKQLKDSKDYVRFGELTGLLHDALVEDPAPYRKTVKELLANLITFIEISQCSSIEVFQPNRSQLLRLAPINS